MTTDSGDQLQCGEAAVGDDHHTVVRQPAFALQYGLTSPVGQGFGPLALRLAPSRRWRQHGQEWQRPSPPAKGTGSTAANDHQRRPLVLT
jgi:hypothetical protein